METKGLDIIGQYIGIWLTREEIEAILGFMPTTVARGFIVGGKVVGESSGIGVWIELEFVAVGDPSDNLYPDLAKEKPRRMIRWDYIRAAELFPDRSSMDRTVDFQPRAA
jgi:hypothetical protein